MVSASLPEHESIRHISHGRTSSWICEVFDLFLLSFSLAIFWRVQLNKSTGGIRKERKSNSCPNGPYVQKALGDQAHKKNSDKYSAQIYTPHMSESVWFTMCTPRSCSLQNITVQSHYIIIEIWSQFFRFNYWFSLALNKSEILQIKVQNCKSFLYFVLFLAHLLKGSKLMGFCALYMK